MLRQATAKPSRSSSPHDGAGVDKAGLEPDGLAGSSCLPQHAAAAANAAAFCFKSVQGCKDRQLMAAPLRLASPQTSCTGPTNRRQAGR